MNMCRSLGIADCGAEAKMPDPSIRLSHSSDSLSEHSDSNPNPNPKEEHSDEELSRSNGHEDEEEDSDLEEEEEEDEEQDEGSNRGSPGVHGSVEDNSAAEPSAVENSAEDTKPVVSGDGSASGNAKGSAKNSLRKGKWTTEEEEYTAKIIHHFNTGLLTLPEGTTLRTYLAQKLNCDPMRITKKFTGSSCLGKRVYHSCERTPATLSDIENAQKELAHFKARFKERLALTEAKKRVPGKNGSKHTFRGMRERKVRRPSTNTRNHTQNSWPPVQAQTSPTQQMSKSTSVTTTVSSIFTAVAPESNVMQSGFYSPRGPVYRPMPLGMSAPMPQTFAQTNSYAPVPLPTYSHMSARQEASPLQQPVPHPPMMMLPQLPMYEPYPNQFRYSGPSNGYPTQMYTPAPQQPYMPYPMEYYHPGPSYVVARPAHNPTHTQSHMQRGVPDWRVVDPSASYTEYSYPHMQPYQSQTPMVCTEVHTSTPAPEQTHHQKHKDSPRRTEDISDATGLLISFMNTVQQQESEKSSEAGSNSKKTSRNRSRRVMNDDNRGKQAEEETVQTHTSPTNETHSRKRMYYEVGAGSGLARDMSSQAHALSQPSRRVRASFG